MVTEILKNGKWVEAKSLKYQPNFIEKVKHLFGIHVWTLRGKKKCVICDIPININGET